MRRIKLPSLSVVHRSVVVACDNIELTQVEGLRSPTLLQLAAVFQSILFILCLLRGDRALKRVWAVAKARDLR